MGVEHGEEVVEEAGEEGCWGAVFVEEVGPGRCLLLLLGLDWGRGMEGLV